VSTRYSLIAMAVSIALATAAHAQQATEGPKTLPKISVEADEPKEYGTRETRSATKTDTPLRDVPQSISIVTSDLIEDLDMRSMGDVVRYVPGVTMGQGEGHRDAPTLRGNATTADFYVDGVRDDVQYFRDLYNAERVEVLKGPNAMAFGRGGGGGVINRVTKWADGQHHGAVTLEGGSDDNKRISADLGEGVSERVSLRLNAMYEDSDSYRDFVNIERFGVNPTALFSLSESTRILVGLERFEDERTVDRGVPSRNGRPVPVDDSVFFGNPDLSYSDATVNLANVTVEHAFSPGLELRNHTLYGDYDKFYQNVFANSAVSDAGNVTLSAYHSGTERQNLFNQTDLIWRVSTGAIEHTILTGVEFGWQDTENFRNNSAYAEVVPITNPVTRSPVSFGVPFQDNAVDVKVQAVYLQDQLELSEHFELIAGVRFDRFDVEFDNHRTGERFARDDDELSTRVGLIYKPVEPASLYASYSVSFLPSSGDQFSSLTATSAALEPEEFENVEVGVKWDVREDLALTAAIYRLDRTNTTAVGPNNTTVQTGAQRSEGVELGLNGAVTDRWNVIVSYSNQDAEITRTTSAAPEGRAVPLVPEHQFALWNRYRFSPKWGAGLGVTYLSDVYTSITNGVELPGYTRVDAAIFFAPSERFEARLNVENVLDETYWWTAHNDNNITPGSPTAFRLGVTARF
jgi:catecholate siderophore receptor